LKWRLNRVVYGQHVNHQKKRGIKYFRTRKIQIKLLTRNFNTYIMRNKGRMKMSVKRWENVNKIDKKTLKGIKQHIIKKSWKKKQYYKEEFKPKEFFWGTFPLLIICSKRPYPRRWNCWCLNSKDKGATTTKKKRKDWFVQGKNKLHFPYFQTIYLLHFLSILNNLKSYGHVI